MMPIDTYYSNSDHGMIFVARRDDRSVTGVSKSELLTAAAIALTKTVAALSERLLPEALDTEIRDRSGPLRLELRSYFGTAAKEKRAIADADFRMREIPANVRTDHFQEIRAKFVMLDTPTALALVAKADLETLAALVDGGQTLTGLHGDVWEVIERRFIELAHIERTGLLANYQMQPTVDDLLASGPDHLAAETAAREALAMHVTRKTDLADVEVELLSMLRWLANVENRSASEMLGLTLAA